MHPFSFCSKMANSSLYRHFEEEAKTSLSHFKTAWIEAATGKLPVVAREILIWNVFLPPLRVPLVLWSASVFARASRFRSRAWPHWSCSLPIEIFKMWNNMSQFMPFEKYMYLFGGSIFDDDWLHFGFKSLHSLFMLGVKGLTKGRANLLQGPCFCLLLFELLLP